MNIVQRMNTLREGWRAGWLQWVARQAEASCSKWERGVWKREAGRKVGEGVKDQHGKKELRDGERAIRDKGDEMA